MAPYNHEEHDTKTRTPLEVFCSSPTRFWSVLQAHTQKGFPFIKQWQMAFSQAELLLKKQVEEAKEREEP